MLRCENSQNAKMWKRQKEIKSNKNAKNLYGQNTKKKKEEEKNASKVRFTLVNHNNKNKISFRDLGIFKYRDIRI